MPHAGCIRSWTSNSTGEGQPGINPEAIRAVERIANDIRRHVSWNEAKDQFFGFITYGKKDAGAELPIASQALVFLLTGLNVEFSIPIAYFFINGLKATAGT